MKVLILHPDFRDPGGVASYYKKIANKFNHSVKHFIIGKRPKEKTFKEKIIRMYKDYIYFIKILRHEKYDIIHVNPSFDPKSFIRDGIFLLIAKIYKKKTIVFFHGWTKSYEEHISFNGIWKFNILYGKANAFIVLANEFKKTMESWGCKQPIYREVTVIEDEVFMRININKINENRLKSDKVKILFLSRILREKGIYETIEAFSILKRKHGNIELIIGGDGNELQFVKKLVNDRSITDVKFIGYVMGKEKYKLFENSHIFCFPTYGEGFPNTIAETMAFGLPIITRPVGGIADFFKNGEHGYITESKDPVIYAEMIEKLIMGKEIYNKISFCNYEYAKENLIASKAINRLERIYESVNKT